MKHPHFASKQPETTSASSTTQLRIDAAHDLTQQAGRHLRRVLGPTAGTFTVVCRDDEFYLAGRVKTWYEKQVAQEALRELAGGRRIHNELLVAG